MSMFVCGRQYPICDIREVVLFSFFPDLLHFKPKNRPSNPFFHTYMITINSIKHLHIYNTDITFHGMKNIFYKFISRTQYFTCNVHLSALSHNWEVHQFVLFRSSYYSVSSLSVWFLYMTTISSVATEYNLKMKYVF